jgi:hypothetical protein
MSWRRVLPEKLTVAQLLILFFFFFYRTCKFITISTTAWLTPSHLIPLANCLLFSHVQSGPKKFIHTLTWKILLYNRNYRIYTKAKLIWEMSLNFGFNVGVRNGNHRHPNTVQAAELLQECIHFFGPLCILHWTISLLQPICLVHFKHHADTTKWEIKKVRHWQSMANIT